jgi:hypothetical protein
LLQEIHVSHHKRSEEDKTVWQREREEIQGQVNRLRVEVLAAENDNATLGDICKEHEEDKAGQREREAMQVNRLREELLAAANAKASLDEMSKKREEDKAVWQREREEMQRQVIRLREELRSGTATQSNTHGQTLQLQRTHCEDERARLEAVLLQGMSETRMTNVSIRPQHDNLQHTHNHEVLGGQTETGSKQGSRGNSERGWERDR